jgi:Carboxypeptidase regulatory-like domain
VTLGSTRGTISGVVKDQSGAVIVGTNVVARNTGTGISFSASTDSAGFYSLPDLPVGRYAIEGKQTGFKNYLVEGLTIDANSALRVDTMRSTTT